MDIDLLSRMVGELILEHDQVGLPGVGTFVAEMVPATFSNKGYTIHPPYRRLSFYPSRLEDSLLIKFYAESNQITREASAAYITQYLAELKDVLEERKTIVLPGLGRLRATRENTLFFVPDEDLDIYPAGVGLEPVSLKSLAAEEQEPVVIDVPVPGAMAEEIPGQARNDYEGAQNGDEAVQSGNEAARSSHEGIGNGSEEIGAETEETGTETEGVPTETEESGTETEGIGTDSVENGNHEEEPASTEEIENNGEDLRTPPTTYPAAWIHEDWKEPTRKGLPTFCVILIVLVILAILSLVAFMILARVAPDFIDTLLYTPDELRIINY